MPAPVSNYPYLESDSGSSNYSSPYSSDASVSSFDEFYYPNLSKRRGNKPNKMKNKSNGKRSVNPNNTGRTNNNNMTSCSTNGNGYQVIPWYKNQNVIIGGAALSALVIIAAYFAYRMYRQKNEVVSSLVEMNDELNTYKVAYAKILQNQNNSRVVVDEKSNQPPTHSQPPSSSPPTPFPPQPMPKNTNSQMKAEGIPPAQQPVPIFKKPSAPLTTTSNPPTHRGPPPQFPIAPMMGDFMKSVFGNDIFSPMTPPTTVQKTPHANNKPEKNHRMDDNTKDFSFPMNVMIIEQIDTKPNTVDRKVTVEEEFEDEVKDTQLPHNHDDAHIVTDSTETKNEENQQDENITTSHSPPPPPPPQSKPKQFNNKGGKRKKVIQDLN